MDWNDKSVYLFSTEKPSERYVQKKLEEKGASIISDQEESVDVLVVPVLEIAEKLEKQVHTSYGYNVVTYIDTLVDLLDTDFKPCWISRKTLNPSVFSTIILPEYTKDKGKLEEGELSWDTLAQWADDLELKINYQQYKGSVLVVMPDVVHFNNIDYVRFYLKRRSEKANISFISMKQLEISYKEWMRKHPKNIRKPKEKLDFSLQKQFMDKKWNMVKEETPHSEMDFSNGIPREYVVIDTEYRNVSMCLQYPVVTEIGAVKVVGGEIVDCLELYIHNDLFSLQSMSKYKNQKLKLLSIDQADQILMDFIGDSVIVGHQIHTDLLNLGLNLNHCILNRSIDTLGLIFHEMPFDLGVYNLPSIAEMYNLHKNSHHALDDAITTSELFEMIVDIKTTC